MTYADGQMVCSLAMVLLLALVFVGIALMDYLRHRRNRNQPEPRPAGRLEPIADYCDRCHRPIPQGETVWMDTTTGRILHVRCHEAERDETAVIEVKPDDGRRS